MSDLDARERALFATLPKPKSSTYFRASHVLILEWLPEDERRTGLELHRWMQDLRPGWSSYRKCLTKEEVLKAIDEATAESQASGVIPILHVEAHGDGLDHDGLVGPSASGDLERLNWDELIDPLQKLNSATRCNLLVFFAACTGIAGLKALTRGPRAPALATAGPDSPLPPIQLLAGEKEFYRRLKDQDPALQSALESASQEVGSVGFDYEPLTSMCYDAMVEHLIISMRPDEQKAQKLRLAERLRTEFSLPDEEISRRVNAMPKALPEHYQNAWDEMFMIDIYPENRERFGLDVRRLVEEIVAATDCWYTNA